MNPGAIVCLAVDASGLVVCSDGGDTLAAAAGGALEPLAALPPVAGAPPGIRSRVASMAALEGGGVAVADAAAGRLWRVGRDGRVAPLGPEPGAGRPALVAAAGGRLFWIEARAAGVLVRAVGPGGAEAVELPPSPLRRVTAAAATAEGLYLADGLTPVPALYFLSLGGALRAVAGSPREAGSDDGPRAEARFVRPLSLACDRDGRCYVADGARIRLVGADGGVATLAGSAPGFGDGNGPAARFGPALAVALAPDGRLWVADAENGALRVVAPGGEVTTVCRGAPAGPPPRPPSGPAPVSVADARELARAFGRAVVDGDMVVAAAVADRFLADHAARDRVRPDRTVQPVSVASARVGRELALRWCGSDDERRSRVGAYCLWLIRSAEGAQAPERDAEALVAEVGDALAARDLDRAGRLAGALELALGPARRRDRLALSRAFRATPAASPAPLLASDDALARQLGVRLAGLSRDVRHTPPLAAVALAAGPLAGDAARALRGIWESPCAAREQVGELAAGLRFSRPLLERLAADPAILGERGRRRLASVLAGR